MLASSMTQQISEDGRGQGADTIMDQPSSPLNSSGRSVVLLTGIAWLAMVGFDFLLHAGVLAGLYLRPSPFLLPPLIAFQRIPLGYLSFLLAAVLLAWLMRRLQLNGWRTGALFGLKVGALMWGAFVLGLASISSGSLTLLLAWFVGQTLEMALGGGAVIGSGLAGTRLRRLFGIVLGFVILVVITVIILQSFGIVPTTNLK
jgi:hypothetical protein